MYKILAINPGSTSTKIAVYNQNEIEFVINLQHSSEDLAGFKSVFEQYDFRLQMILKTLSKQKINLSEISVVVGRGGLMKALESGVYEVSETMIQDMKTGREHASNLGAVLARDIASRIPGCKAYITDPVVVDELQEVARISGLPQFPRRSVFHALNHKAIGRKYAQSISSSYEKLNLVIAHLGGGISVAAHKLGRVIDTNQALDGFGSFSPERAGTIDAGALIDLCFSGQLKKEEIKKLLAGKGGLVAHLGTNNLKLASEKALNGDAHAKLIIEAMAYNVAKEIAAMIAVLEGNVNAVILTGGIAHNIFVVNYIQKMIAPMAHIVVYPGEDEMEALALAGLRVLTGEKARVY